MESKGRKNVYRFLRKHVPLPNGFDPLSTDLPEIVAETIANLEKYCNPLSESTRTHTFPSEEL